MTPQREGPAPIAHRRRRRSAFQDKKTSELGGSINKCSSKRAVDDAPAIVKRKDLNARTFRLIQAAAYQTNERAWKNRLKGGAHCGNSTARA